MAPAQTVITTHTDKGLISTAPTSPNTEVTVYLTLSQCYMIEINQKRNLLGKYDPYFLASYRNRLLPKNLTLKFYKNG